MVNFFQHIAQLGNQHTVQTRKKIYYTAQKGGNIAIYPSSGCIVNYSLQQASRSEARMQGTACRAVTVTSLIVLIHQAHTYK